MQKELNLVWCHFDGSIKVQTNRCLQQRLLHSAMSGLGNRASNAPLCHAFIAKTIRKGNVSHRCVIKWRKVIEFSSVKGGINLMGIVKVVEHIDVVSRGNGRHMPMRSMTLQFLECQKDFFVKGNCTACNTTFKAQLILQCPHTYSVVHDGTFKEKEDVPGGPNGEHVCIH
jgi:hypothetical protein